RCPDPHQLARAAEEHRRGEHPAVVCGCLAAIGRVRATAAGDIFGLVVRTSRCMIAFALPTWLERLFRVTPPESGEGTQWALSARWTWPYWLTLLLLAFCVAWVVYAYYRERRSLSRWHLLTLAALRMASLAVVLFMIAGVLLIPARTGLPYIVVMMDVSASMANADTY